MKLKKKKEPGELRMKASEFDEMMRQALGSAPPKDSPKKAKRKPKAKVKKRG